MHPQPSLTSSRFLSVVSFTRFLRRDRRQIIKTPSVPPSRHLGRIFALALLMLACELSRAEARRIVSTSPSITEALFAMGLGPRVVGVSNFCDYPQEVHGLPKVGTYLRPDPELIARLKPDLVLVHKLPNELTDRLAALHIPFAEVDRGTLEGSYTEIRQIGRAAGVEIQAEKLVASLQTSLASIHRRTAGHRPPTVIFIVGREPGSLSNLVVVGHDFFLNDLIDVAGGKNLMASSTVSAYPRIGMETILRLDPDVIVDMGNMGGNAEEREKQAIASKALWQQAPRVRAVREGRVFCLTSSAFLVPGPRSPEAAEMLFSILHGGSPK
jgi:iron complex transport system substrate-binding protein